MSFSGSSLLALLREEVAIECRPRLPSWMIIEARREQSAPLVVGQKLGPGESAVITLGLEMPGATLLLDEKRGRNVAEALGLNVLGTVGVIVRAKERGHVQRVDELLFDLRRKGFNMSDDLVRAAIDAAGEI